MKRFNYQFVLSTIGLLLIIEAVFMLLSALVGEYYNETAVKSIYFSAVICFCTGALITFMVRKRRRTTGNLTKREVFLTVTLSWLVMALFGTLPYLFSGAIPSFTNAFFENMCGFTTTGSSTLVNIEAFPKSLHFWRSFTQWIGGIGIIIFVLSFMPIFGGISSQFYEAEATGIAEDQFRPRIREITKQMSLTYLGLTILGFFFLWAGPMDAFDAACHTLTAISTGGFSTKQASIAFFNSPYTEYVITLLMFLGGTNFLLISTLVTRFKPTIFKDEEFKWYFLIIILFTVGITIALLTTGRMNDIEQTFRTVLFQVVATVTTTGFATADFQLWGSAYWLLFLVMILFCGSEGSTSGGMKISRLIALSKNALLVFKRQVHPNALYVVKMNRKVITGETLSRLFAFVFLYVSIAVISAVILGLTGMNFEESIGVSLSSISNYGFGLGSYGPSGTFESATPFMKYYLSFLMLVGRLEIFTVLSLFVPGFWKR
ncbi:MAG: TrkH family potassium uptake protein [Proteiniphilum sp.]|uniref:TrkH family potassium uptake protein n=1 Tax=Proteiniphilum sp. TaxID=1926877 RepID=UPI002B1F3718|nr:TrkH family potassium uptake protein [Proteiniphilum sp.]MEA5127041.1 TrkH family potassium uptake protein [Proteiniphilum sp.]